MRNTWNPTRRNRNIGTSKAGHSENNKLVIPSRFLEWKIFWEIIDDYKVHTREINGRIVKFIVEHNHRNHMHCCSVDDVAFLLTVLPVEDWEGINLFIFRQPKRKEEILSSVWGRLGYNVDIGSFKGPAIILESIDLSKPLIWKKSLNPETVIELERMKQDGHKVTLNKREYIIEISQDSVRATQLYRTLLHEIGHWVQWDTIVLKPSSEGFDRNELEENYFRIPSNEKEVFAHRYADIIREKLIENNVIPFGRKDNEENV
ncbi:MAG: hypothetical protein APF81_02695 [Desulfosporosinus sp. BRH_c37]|nr:MAG: hypothetical protein APF81_02695 [Desulfosporosinus sp. BRH_c37]